MLKWFRSASVAVVLSASLTLTACSSDETAGPTAGPGGSSIASASPTSPVDSTSSGSISGGATETAQTSPNTEAPTETPVEASTEAPVEVSSEAPASAEAPTTCPETPGLTLAADWEATTEEKNFQVSHQCTFSSGDIDKGDFFTVTSQVIPRPSGLEGPAVMAFEIAPCEGDSCVGAAQGLELGAVAKGVEPTSNSVVIAFENPGKMDVNGTEYEYLRATAWVQTENNLCKAEIGARVAEYAADAIDTLIAELHANATATCGLTA